MLPRDPTAQQWGRCIYNLDRQLRLAADVYRSRSGVDANSAKLAWQELQRLLDGQEPNYDFPGLPLPYTFRYVPHRVSALCAALCRLGYARRGRVLDIGSGTGVGALALWLYGAELVDQLVCMEPSREMTTMAECALPSTLKARTKFIHGGFDDLPALEGSTFQLILLSACLPYRFRRIDYIVRCLINLADAHTTIVVTEPEAKISDLQLLVREVERHTDWHVSLFSSSDLPTVFRSRWKLSHLNAVSDDLQLGIESQAWNGAREEYFASFETNAVRPGREAETPHQFTDEEKGPPASEVSRWPTSLVFHFQRAEVHAANQDGRVVYEVYELQEDGTTTLVDSHPDRKAAWNRAVRLGNQP